MQTVKRCAYALASYNSKTQSHEDYLERKSFLEVSCKEMIDFIKKANYNKDKIVAINARYSDQKNITACAYRGTLFIGFQERNSKKISLTDKSNSFADMDKDVPAVLERRLLNAVMDAEKNRYNMMTEQLAPMWEKLTPVLDKIIDYEKNFEKMPESKQRLYERSGLKEQDINEIIEEGEKQLLPEVERILENMTGMDIGHVGKRDEYANMSYLEQDIAEKHHNRDLGESGYVDEAWHDREHLAPLEERFAHAIREAREAVKATPDGIKTERVETEELVRMR